MPTLRKLDPAPVATFERLLSMRQRIAAEYDGYLADFAVDEYDEVTVQADESRPVVRRRLWAPLLVSVALLRCLCMLANHAVA